VWVGNVLQGDLGDSAVTRQPVGRQVVNAFGNSVILATFSIVLALSLGLVMGTIAAVNRGRWIDRATTALAVTGTSVPSYWLGLVMIYVFAVDLGWFPTGGRTTLDDGSLVDQFRHLVLPGTTLALAATGTIARVTRTSLLEVLDQDYIRTARAKGVSETHVTIGHALRNALIPVVNVAGLQIGFLLGSAIVIEQVFAWPGAGRLVYNSIAQRDYPVLQGSVLFIATAFVLVNLVVDLLSTYLDPRVRFA
jgi:ABC-type dipeptide/oligopeptide/nickel transport system permease component